MVIPASLHLPFTSLQPIGIICLVLVGAYASWGVLRKTPITVREWEFSVPSISLSLCQIALSCVDWALAASVCYILLPSSPSLSYLSLLSMFLLEQVIGLVSQVPGALASLRRCSSCSCPHPCPPPRWPRALWHTGPCTISARLSSAQESSCCCSRGSTTKRRSSWRSCLGYCFPAAGISTARHPCSASASPQVGSSLLPCTRPFVMLMSHR
jgi:hypothetical protein